MSNATIPDSIGNPIDFTQHLHKVNDKQIVDENMILDENYLVDGVIKLSAGKKKHVLVKT